VLGVVARALGLHPHDVAHSGMATSAGQWPADPAFQRDRTRQ
jgi:hypothetical protein